MNRNPNDLRANPGRALAPYVNHRPYTGLPTGPAPGTAIATTPYRPNFTMGGTPPPAPAAPPPVTPQMAEARRAAALARNGARAPQPGYAGNSPTRGAASSNFRGGDVSPPKGAPVVTNDVVKATKKPGLVSRTTSSLGRGVGVAGAGLAMADAMGGQVDFSDGSLRDVEGSTARYAKRFGMNEPTGDGSFGDIAKFATLRGLGYASDLGNNLTGGLVGKYLYQDEPGMPNTSAIAAQATKEKAAREPAPVKAGNEPNGAVIQPQAQPQPTLRGSDGREYLPGPITAEERLASDRVVNAAFGNKGKPGGEFSMDAGINTLRSDPVAMSRANQGWAMRGSGVQASKDANGGLVLSDSTAPEKMAYVDREGNPTERYENTAQYDNGQEQLANARASLRNPDGSSWGETDNATYAANLRDGVDPIRGTSRPPQGASVEEQLRSASQEYVDPNRRRAPGRGLALRTQIDSLTKRADTESTNRTTQRGQDKDIEERQIVARSAAATAAQAQANSDRTFGLATRTQMQAEQTAAETGRAKQDDQWNEHASRLFRRNDATGKSVADDSTIAEFTKATDNTIKSMIADLQNSKNPKEREYAAQLAQHGRRMLKEDDRAAMYQNFRISQVHEKGSGNMFGFGPSGRKDDDLRQYAISGKRVDSMQNRVATKGGQQIPEVDLVYGTGANRLFPNSGAGSNELLPPKLRN